MSSSRLAGKVALVTGSARGIGRAVALELASEGADIAVNYLTSADAAEATVGEIKALGVKAVAIQADVSDAEQVNNMVSTVVEKLGDLSILVNNAGLTRDGLVVRMSQDNWKEVIDSNLTGTFNCLQRCAKHMMKKRYGRIMNLSSVVGIEGNAGQANYAASKAGIIGLANSVAKELGSRSVTVNTIAPGFIETEMTQELSEDRQQMILNQIPLGRFGSPEEIGKLTAFLCSDDAAYITGATIRIDGGIMM